MRSFGKKKLRPAAGTVGLLCVLLLGAMRVSADETKAETTFTKEIGGASERNARPAPSRNDETEPEEPSLASARVEARVVGPNPAYVGQMVVVEVAVLRDDRQTEGVSPFFPEIEVRDAIVVRSASAPPPTLRSEGGVRFLVQKRRYLVFPQAEGVVSVPPISVTLLGPKDESTTALGPSLQIQADIPKGTGDKLPLIARKVSLERRIDGDIAGLRVGDAFTVSLRISAEDTDPILLPTLEFPDLPGLTRYKAESRTRANTDRGNHRAERVETATYVAKDWGSYELPRVSLQWLDPATGRYAEAEVPSLSFRARVNPSLGTGCLGGPRAAARAGGWTGFLVLSLFLAFRLLRARRRSRQAHALVHWGREERAAFVNLRRAAKSGRDGATLTALYRWLCFTSLGERTLEALRNESADEALVAATLRLEERVSGGSGEGRTDELIGPLSSYRRRRRVRQKVEQLPPLNGARSKRDRAM